VINDVDDLKMYYDEVKRHIISRLDDFKEMGFKDNNCLFRELVFCILTANTSAKMSLKAISSLDDVIFTGTEKDIVDKLKNVYRFLNVRANYIYRSRKFLEKEFDFDLHSLCKTFTSQWALRDYLKTNIIGIGYKECSHFLRNIGFTGFAILDKHVISMLNLLGCNVQKPRNKKEYKEVEQKMIDFAKHIQLDIDHLDLVFWSYKTGEIIK
jgi:N-glycosylase/DNA lyase